MVFLYYKFVQILKYKGNGKSNKWNKTYWEFTSR